MTLERLLSVAIASSSGPTIITDAAALAAVALIGYLFGRRTRDLPEPEPTDNILQAELARATSLARDLSEVTMRVRRELAAHQGEIAEFQRRVEHLQAEQSDAVWHRLSAEAENLLGPTLKLSTNLSLAYDQLRKQSTQLMTFAGSRIDAATGVHNRRAMQEQLDVLFSMQSEGHGGFSLALFSFSDNNQEVDEHALSQFAKLLKNSVRGTDFVSRYSSDEFAVLMPKTSLAGAVVFCHRLLAQADEELGRHVWGGVVESLIDDHSARLLSRADSALYSARTYGQTCLFQHAAGMLRRRPLTSEGEPAPLESPSAVPTRPAEQDAEPVETPVAAE